MSRTSSLAPMQSLDQADLPTISVVTASFQQARFVETTLKSVIDQGYPRLEYIVMDGGSTDGSAEIIAGYADRLAYWTSGPDGGQTRALIEGFRRSTGDVMCWLNSDDLLEPGSLWEVAAFFNAHPEARAVYGDAIWIDAKGNHLRHKREHPFNRFIWMHDHNFIPQPSTFWRRDLYLDVGGLNPEFELAMDADLFIRFADVTKLHHVDRVWSRMRLYPDQKNQRLRARSNEEDALIRSRYLPPQPQLLWTAKRRIARIMRIAWKAATRRYR